MPLVYSSKRPTRPGWYWLREPVGTTYMEYVREVEDSEEDLVVLEGDFTYSTSSEGYKTTLWAGPIDKPMTVEEYHLGGYIT